MGISEHAPPSIYNQYAAVYDRTGQIRFAVMIHVYLQDVLHRHPVPGMRMLDLACGTGTLVLMQSERGWDATGLDQSSAMLQQARAKQALAGTPATFVEGDMRDFSFPQPFDLVTCFYDSLNYLVEPDDMLACFKAVGNVLAPGGLFCFDLATDHFLRVYWQGSEHYEDTTYQQVTESSFDAAARLSTLVLRGVLHDTSGHEQQFEEVHVERAYTIAEIEDLLDRAALEVVALYDCFTFQPPNERCLRYFWVTRRKGD